MTTEIKKLKSIYDVKFSSSDEFYWFDENCLRESNDTFRRIFPNSMVTDEELNFFREQIMLA